MTLTLAATYLELVNGSRKETLSFPLHEVILDGDLVIITGRDGQARNLDYSEITGYASASDLYDAIQAVASPASGGNYKVYRALLTQTGTNAPVATVLENTLGGTVVWSYSGVGEYIATCTGLFPTNKTFVMAGDFINVIIAGDNNTFTIYTYDIAAIPTTDNGVLSQTAIEILVYP